MSLEKSAEPAPKIRRELESQLAYIRESKLDHGYSRAVPELFDLATSYVEDAEAAARAGKPAAWVMGLWDAPLLYACDTIPISLTELGRMGSAEAMTVAEDYFQLPKETCSMVESIPDVAILCYTKFLTQPLRNALNEQGGSLESKVFPGLHFVGDSVAFVENTTLLGAPMAAVQLERLIQLGIRRFVVVGIAGSLKEGVEIGDVVIGDRAVRDEGTSHHYLPASDYAWPSVHLTGQVIEHLRTGGLPVQVGGTWTTDAIFRETLLEVRALAEEGIVTVEMEAAALFTVAKFRGVDIAAAFVVSDLVHRRDWKRGQDGSILGDRAQQVLSRLADFRPGSGGPL